MKKMVFSVICALVGIVGLAGTSYAQGQAGGATPPTKTPQGPDTPEVTCEAKNPAPTQTVELPEDARAIDFGPWVNSFMAEVKRNWFVPYRAMTKKGCAVITVQFHKDGSHENPIVKNPSASSDYTRAAYNAIVAVSRMAPLPAQYQKDSLEFTITISYDPRDAETLLNQNAKPAK
jgi:TonB family protein